MLASNTHPSKMTKIHNDENDKNMALNEPDEFAIFNQLPEQVQDSIYSGFLFTHFLLEFMQFFRVVNGTKFGVT